ncbi:hypothetical protein H4Q26_011865 [Puccinia striiformis f. sp. tritici PST-130]|nr:hypothetical protein H4Q26_011865 [Puccinia striiformis f. sp. tritici PST-130]
MRSPQPQRHKAILALPRFPRPTLRKFDWAHGKRLYYGNPNTTSTLGRRQGIFSSNRTVMSGVEFTDPQELPTSRKEEPSVNFNTEDRTRSPPRSQQ